MNFEEVLDVVGSFGRFQKGVVAMVLLAVIPNAWMDMMFAFTQYESEFHCELPPWINISENSATYEELLNRSIPWEVNSYGVPTRSRCKMYKIDNSSSIENISKQQYNRSYQIECKYGFNFKDFNSATAEFSMVCGNSWKSALPVTAAMIGMGVGSFSGYFSDRFGRRLIFMVFKFAQFMFAGLLSMSWNYTSYVVLSFMVGVSTMINYTTGFILATELLGVKRRLQIGMAVCFFYSIGFSTSPLVGYLLPNWRWYLRANCFVGLLYLPMLCFFPESLRWCLVSGKKEQSIALMERMAKENGKQIRAESIYESFHRFDTSERKENACFAESRITREDKSYLLQCCNPTIRMRYVTLCISWVATTTLYFAISLYPTYLSGDRIVNIFLIGLAEVPSVAIAYFLPRAFGRVRSTAVLYLLAGLSSAVSPYLRKVSALSVTILVLVAKTTITASFDLIYLITTEISPTLIRSTSLGVASVCGRVGSILMPFFMLAGNGENDSIPYIVMGSCAIGAGILYLFFIPETGDMRMPDSLEMALRNKRVYGLNLTKDFKSTNEDHKPDSVKYARGSEL